jgi:acetolactate synthase-1/2/3 large subunit
VYRGTELASTLPMAEDRQSIRAEGGAARALVADFIAGRLVEHGVRHVFGVGGANIEDLFSAVQRRRPVISAVLGKHEHAAGTAADAYARIRGLGVVMVTSGGGAMNLVHSLAEARASRVPLLALVGEPPTDLQGRGAFQDTSGKGDSIDALAVFRAVTTYARRVERADDVPRLLDEALQAVRGANSGPAVLLIAKDLQTANLPNAGASLESLGSALVRPNGSDLDFAVECLAARPVVVIAGPEVARAHAEECLADLALRLGAAVATTPDGRDAFDNRAPAFLGVCGAMGHAAVAGAVAEARVVVLAGTRLPLLARQGLEAVLREKVLVSLGAAPPFVTGARQIHVAGDLSNTLRELAKRIGATPVRASAAGSSERPPVVASTEASSFTTATVLGAVERLAPDRSVVLVDAGNTGASSAHYVRVPRGGRFLLAMGMAGMGYAFGGATGAALATGERCIVLAGDGAFFMQGLEIHTAVEHALPITYVLFDNRAHGMCLVRERLLLGENAGYNAFRRSHLGAGLAAMFPGLTSVDCTTLPEVEAALTASFSCDGPSVICAELPEVEVPPFTAFQQRAPERKTVPRGDGNG